MNMYKNDIRDVDSIVVIANNFVIPAGTILKRNGKCFECIKEATKNVNEQCTVYRDVYTVGAEFVKAHVGTFFKAIDKTETLSENIDIETLYNSTKKNSKFSFRKRKDIQKMIELYSKKIEKMQRGEVEMDKESMTVWCNLVKFGKWCINEL